MRTTTQVAALLTERGWTDKDGGPVRPETVHQWCKRKKFPHAQSVGSRIWQIPLSDVDALQKPQQGRPKKDGKVQRRSSPRRTTSQD